jgi:hypothetical protein
MWNMQRNTDVHQFIASKQLYSSLYTEAQLRNIHRKLGHPTVARIMSVLENSSRVENLDSTTRSMLQQIEDACKPCQQVGPKPSRFRFQIRNPDAQFNHAVIRDVMTLEKRPVLHAIDEATRFQAARFLAKISAREVWDSFRMMWADVYCGPPDVLKTDPGRNFTAAEFAAASASHGIVLRVQPVDAHELIGLVERYHHVVREAYRCITLDTPSLSSESRLSMTMRAVNDSSGPDGLIPTLLVSECIPFWTYLTVRHHLWLIE